MSGVKRPERPVTSYYATAHAEVWLDYIFALEAYADAADALIKRVGQPLTPTTAIRDWRKAFDKACDECAAWGKRTEDEA